MRSPQDQWRVMRGWCRVQINLAPSMRQRRAMSARRRCRPTVHGTHCVQPVVDVLVGGSIAPRHGSLHSYRLRVPPYYQNLRLDRNQLVQNLLDDAHSYSLRFFFQHRSRGAIEPLTCSSGNLSDSEYKDDVAMNPSNASSNSEPLNSIALSKSLSLTACPTAFVCATIGEYWIPSEWPKNVLEPPPPPMAPV